MFFLIKLTGDDSKFSIMDARDVEVYIEKTGEGVEYTIYRSGMTLYQPEDVLAVKLLNAEEVKLSL